MSQYELKKDKEFIMNMMFSHCMSHDFSCIDSQKTFKELCEESDDWWNLIKGFFEVMAKKHLTDDEFLKIFIMRVESSIKADMFNRLADKSTQLKQLSEKWENENTK